MPVGGSDISSGAVLADVVIEGADNDAVERRAGVGHGAEVTQDQQRRDYRLIAQVGEAFNIAGQGKRR